MGARLFDRVKVMGERASGTHFLSQLIELNFAAQQLPNITSCSPEQFATIRQIPEARRHHLAIAERTEDYNHLTELSENGGWKHAALTDRVFKDLVAADDTLFLCILHPASCILHPASSGVLACVVHAPAVPRLQRSFRQRCRFPDHTLDDPSTR